MRDLLKPFIMWLLFVVLSVLALLMNAHGAVTRPQAERVVAYLYQRGEASELSNMVAFVIPLTAKLEIDGEKKDCNAYCGFYLSSDTKKTFLQVHLEIPIDDTKDGEKQVVTHFVRDCDGDAIPDMYLMSTVVYAKNGVQLKNYGWHNITDTDASKRSLQLWDMAIEAVLKAANKHFKISEA